MLHNGDRLRVQGVGTPLPSDTERARLSGSIPSGFPKRTCGALPLSGLPQGEAHGTHEHHTRTIAYPIRMCCSDHCSVAILSGRPVRISFTPCIPDLLMAKDFKASFLHVSELQLLCHGFQRTLLNLRLLW